MYRVSPNAVYIFGREVENIVRINNYVGKHGQKTIGDAVRKLIWSARVVSSFQIRTACSKDGSLYKKQVGG